MKKKSNEYGFTLVELLVTIAIMLSITVLAIVNIVGVSNRKKEEAWVSVKEEIETAASDYFKYNEYLFEGLGGTGTGTISVGSLVSDDYINKVTHPRTGKALSYCTKVNVTKTNRGITTEIDDDTISSSNNPSDCDDAYSVTVSNAKNAPKISIKNNCEVSKDAADPTWCSNKGNVTITATATETNDSSIKSFAAESRVNIDTDDHNTTTKEIKCYINKETSSSSVKFVAESVDGGKTETIIDKLKWDKTAPEGNLSIVSSNKSGYNSNKVYLSLKVDEKKEEELSGFNKDKIEPSISNVSFVSAGDSNYQTKPFYIAETLDGKTKNASVTIYDNAGNKRTRNSNDYVVYKECTNKVADGSSTSTSDCSKSCGGGTQTKKTVYKYKDANTGKSCTSEENSETLACNTQSCQELSCPTVTVKGAVKGNGNWYKKGNSDTQIEIKPTSGTSYWSWATDGSDGNLKVWSSDNKGTQLKSLGDGKRKYQIVVYDSNGNSKKCDGNLWIDTTKPSVKINYIKVYQVNGSLANLRSDNVKNRNDGGDSVPKLLDKSGGVASCLKKGQQYSSGSDMYTCKEGSSYSVSDNLTSSSNLYLKYYVNVISGDYCTHKNSYGCSKANTPYPFPTKYKLCAIDEAGNEGCSEIKVAFLSEKTYDLKYGTGYSNSKFSWDDKVWSNNSNNGLTWEGYNR